ncbi:non-ribosomal peptide synthetase [Paenibacillus sp. SYP-B4298]|uniref:non-ribosomal peptide synthetase n=1 Tax=Paenibacillus sp. SYP-B4298 TaxID=2996034 RepID=UPI0022DE2174|nr:amino acid adenylation domain-containing protein [Paenibacillus sp. SYP-B4298]
MSRLDSREEILNQLSEEQRQLLMLKLKAKSRGQERPRLERVERAPGDRLFPLSYAQEQIWFLEQLQPGQVTYNSTWSCELNGELQTDWFETCLHQIVERHEVLRTVYVEQGGVPYQQILPPGQRVVTRLDLSALSGEEQAAEIARIHEEERSMPLKLSEAPLLRAVLLKKRERSFQLLLTMHHIVADGLSFGIIFRELSELYDAQRTGRPCALQDMPVQYVDFACWQRTTAETGGFEAELSYWRQALDGAPQITPLPLDRPRPGVLSARGGVHRFHYPKELLERLKELGRQHDATLFMTMLAAFNVLLYRYTGQEDIVIGSLTSNRVWPETEQLIGCFLNSIVLRTDLSGQPTFSRLLDRVKQRCMDAYRHQSIPFEKLIEELRPHRSLSANPIYQVLFELQKVEHGEGRIGDIEVKMEEADTDTAKFDLFFSIMETEHGLSGFIEYRSDLFDASTIHHMNDHFHQLLNEVTEQQHTSIASLRMLTSAETAQQLQEWNFSPEGGSALTEEPSFLSRIEAMAVRHGQRTAVRCGEQRLSYSELNRRANKLAHRLQAIGIGPEARVGICLERSVELVVALLGVAKAGGAYVPLAPSLPAERLAYMLRSAKVQALVSCQAELDEADGGERLAQAAAEQGAELVLLDRDAALLSREAETNPAAAASAAHTMYVIFTSGSTGLPKGAIVYRKGFANLLKWYTEAFGMNEQDKVLLVSSPSFDLTQKNIFAPLMTGGELVLLPSGIYDPAEVSSLIDTHGITLWNGTPSAFYPLLEESEPSGYSELQTLRYVFLGGEAIAAERLMAWTSSESCRAGIVNTYGPTECTDVTVYGIVERLDELAGKAVPIGRPVPGTQAYILNEGLGLLPVGAIGELCLAGVQVGGGYVGDEEKTATQFVPNPYGTGKLYRTGDLARYLADGTIAYLGRRDHQVKIRGYRIEPGEVEAALRLCEGVKDAAVVAREDRPGEKRLVAYVVLETMEAAAPAEVALGGAGQAAESRGGRDTDQQQQQLVRAHDSHGAEGDSDWARHLHEERLRALRQELKERLPEYMVPETLLRLEQLPLSPNGKVDRKALPEPEERAGGGREESYAAPRNAVEEAMAAIWAEVLQVERVGIHDHFFERGGHSLLAMQAVSRMRTRFRTELSVHRLFHAPTIAQLSASIDPASVQAAPAPRIPKLSREQYRLRPQG